MRKKVEESSLKVKELKILQQGMERIRGDTRTTLQNERMTVNKEPLEAMKEREKLTKDCRETVAVLVCMKAKSDGILERYQ